MSAALVLRPDVTKAVTTGLAFATRVYQAATSMKGRARARPARMTGIAALCAREGGGAADRVPAFAVAVDY